MKSSIIRKMCLLLSLGITLASGSSGAAALIEIPKIGPPKVLPSGVVIFKDSRLEQAIRESIPYLNKQPSEPILQKDVNNYCTLLNDFWLGLSLTNKQIKDLDGIEAFAGCKHIQLGLKDNNISDLTPLEKLTTLGVLDISGNQITDLSALSGLLSLTTLFVNSNPVSDFSPLNKITALRILAANNTNSKDLSSIAFIPGLTQLYVNDNGLTHLDPLNAMKSLQSLSANGNSLTDISPIANLSNLQILSFYNNQISMVPPLENLNKLTKMDLSHNQINQISELSAITSIADLNLQANQIIDIQALASLNKLVRLNVSDNQISDLGPLSNLNLNYLYISDNQIEDLTPLSNLTNLLELKLSSNQITSISTLQTLKKLYLLEAANNWISNIDSLSYITSNLKEVNLESNALNLGDPHIKQTITQLTINGGKVNVVHQDPNKPKPAANGEGTHGSPDMPMPETTPQPTTTQQTTAQSTSTQPTTIQPAAPPTTASPNMNTIPFNDIAEHWAKADVEWAYAKGMVNGVAPGIFGPDLLTTEEQFLKMLLLATKVISEQPESLPWSEKYYTYANAHDFPVNGNRRDQPLTRTAAAELVAVSQGVHVRGDQAIQYLLDNKLSEGKTAATLEGYHGEDRLTRAESVRFIRNVINQIKS